MTPGNTAILIGLGLFWAIVFALRSAYLAGVRDTRSIWQDHLEVEPDGMLGSDGGGASGGEHCSPVLNRGGDDAGQDGAQSAAGSG